MPAASHSSVSFPFRLPLSTLFIYYFSCLLSSSFSHLLLFLCFSLLFSFLFLLFFSSLVTSVSFLFMPISFPIFVINLSYPSPFSLPQIFSTRPSSSFPFCHVFLIYSSLIELLDLLRMRITSMFTLSSAAPHTFLPPHRSVPSHLHSL